MRMGMAIGAFTTGTAVTIRIIAALTTLTIAPIIDMRRIADIGSSSNCKETAAGGLLATL
jgi:hypothetical protein